MLIGYSNQHEVKGTYFKFKIKVTLLRNKRTEHFGCFTNNDKQSHIYFIDCFADSLQGMFSYIQHWNRQQPNVYIYTIDEQFKDKLGILDILNLKKDLMYFENLSGYYLVH